MNAILPITRNRGFFGRPRLNLFDELFENFGLSNLESREGDWRPSIDVSETDAELIVKAELPGITKDNVQVTLTNGLLTIKGEKKVENDEKKEGYHLVERRYGSFCRTFRVSEDIDADKIDAAYKDGVLAVTLPKIEPAKPRAIEVK